MRYGRSRRIREPSRCKLGNYVVSVKARKPDTSRPHSRPASGRGPDQCPLEVPGLGHGQQFGVVDPLAQDLFQDETSA